MRETAEWALVAELVFFTGPMDCGKSTLALQVHHTQRVAGRAGELFTSHDRAGESLVSSRLGLASPAREVGPGFDFFRHVVSALTSGQRLDFLVCDECQFYSAEQIDQLARVVDDLQLDVFAFGILTDFQTRMFPGSRRLVELADRVETLQVQPLCWCGRRATHNARVVDGRMVTEGSQVVVGDTEEPTAVGDQVLSYEVLCRQHHRRRMTRAVAQATLSPEPLPFGED